MDLTVPKRRIGTQLVGPDRVGNLASMSDLPMLTANLAGRSACAVHSLFIRHGQDEATWPLGGVRKEE